MYLKFFLLIFTFSLLGNLPKSALDPWKQKLVDSAMLARNNAYAPYSKYLVGAALLTTQDKVYSGCNVENASYGLTICAERSAIFSAVSENAKDIKAIAVVTKDGGFPCGACRQVMNEFNPTMIVIVSNEDGSITKEVLLSDLLISSFGPKNLE